MGFEEVRQMDRDTRLDIVERRSYKVVKANDLIRKARYDLGLRELKALAYCISLIKPNDSYEQEYYFSIKEYCRVAGISYTSGTNYKEIKKSLETLRNTAFWLADEDGGTEYTGWIENPKVLPGRGKIIIRFSKVLKKHIFALFENFTQYELISTLPMQSAYSFRMYELLKSYAYTRAHTFDIDELKKSLAAERYVNFKDFRRAVIERAVREINLYTDIEVSWEPITEGRKVVSVAFQITQRDVWGQIAAEKRANDQIDGQMTIYDYIEGGKKE